MDKELTIKEKEAIMRWKLGLGNLNNVLQGKSPIPEKTKKAEHIDALKDMPASDVSVLDVQISIDETEMGILRMGHIPETQEDHWYMYCDDSNIRYYRSWTGQCAYIGHFHKSDNGYVIDKLTVNPNLAEFGVNGDNAAFRLFFYLIIAEIGGDSEKAWGEYIKAWEESDRKYQMQHKRSVEKESEEVTDFPESDDVSEVKDYKEEKGVKHTPAKNIKKEYMSKMFMKCRVAGISYHDIDDVWDELDVGDPVVLVRQKNNPHDSNAVAIALPDDYDGNPDDFDFDFILGYVPKNQNVQLAAMLDMGWADAFEARISEKKDDESDFDKLKISIFIKSKTEIDVGEDTVKLRALSLNDSEYWEFRESLWNTGSVAYRWGGFPDVLDEDKFPKKGDKIVIVYKHAEDTVLYLMSVAKVGDDVPMKDDCMNYILTNIVGPIVENDDDVDWLNGEDLGCRVRPGEYLSQDATESLINIFRTADAPLQDVLLPEH